jgi:hypothetical protein
VSQRKAKSKFKYKGDTEEEIWGMRSRKISGKVRVKKD